MTWRFMTSVESPVFGWFFPEASEVVVLEGKGPVGTEGRLRDLLFPLQVRAARFSNMFMDVMHWALCHSTRADAIRQKKSVDQKSLNLCEVTCPRSVFDNYTHQKVAQNLSIGLRLLLECSMKPLPLDFLRSRPWEEPCSGWQLTPANMLWRPPGCNLFRTSRRVARVAKTDGLRTTRLRTTALPADGSTRQGP